MVVLLFFAALVINVGDWYAHKRQLQNRADAGALAAAVAYQQSWAACVGGDTATATNIENNARAYAGDPVPTSPVIPAVNTETASQANVEVHLNSTSYDSAATDGCGACFNHAGDDISPAGGYWTDVKVKERNLGSFFGSLGIPLSRNIARARVEIRPAVSDNGFIPLAVPEQKIVKAQVRYYNHCTSPATLLAKSDLTPLKTAYQTVSGTTLWGPSVSGSQNIPGATVDPTALALTMPASAGCGQAYVPIGVEIRVAGRDVDIDTPSCATLSSSRFTGCWSRLSEIRAWKQRDPAVTPYNPVFGDVVLGTAGCSPDSYFSRTPSCASSVSVNVDWGDLDDGTRNVPANFSVKIQGQALSPPAGANASGTWTRIATIATNGTGGATQIDLAYAWKDEVAAHGPWRGNVCKQGNSPCSQQGTSAVHRTFVGTDANAGTVDMIRTAGAPQPPSGQPQLSLATTPAPLTSPNSLMIYPTIGLRSSLRTGQKRTLRASDAQGNQSLDCNPTGGQGHDFQMFLNGCQPHYGPNTFTQGTWWDVPSQQCPGATTIFSQPNSSSEFWQCVPAAPGFSASVIADGAAARTGNCTNIQNNSCSQTSCIHPNEYTQWLAGTSTDESRIVKLFIVPYGAFKGVNAQDGVPLLDFASFYITGWGGNGSNNDPCSGDDAAQAGEIVGYFIEFVGPNTGPVDPNAVCVVGQIRPCRAVLVR